MRSAALSRSAPMARGTTPMKRSAMPRGMPLLAAAASPKKEKPVSKLPAVLRKQPGRPKMTPIRRSARGESCTLQFPGCRNDTATTVWCHSNRAADGKGMGIKARDEEGCYGCAFCHAFLDFGYVGHLSREEAEAVFDRARVISQFRLRAKGLLLAVPVDAVIPAARGGLQ